MNPLSSDELDSEEMRHGWLKAACFSSLHWNRIVSMTLHLVCLKPAVSCVVRAVDTIDGEPFIGLISR